MADSKHIDCQAPFKDLSNNIYTDPKERKRQRARDRYAQMPRNQKDEFLKKRCEAYHRKKAKAVLAVEVHQLFCSESDQTGSKQSTLTVEKVSVGPNDVQHSSISAYGSTNSSFLEEVAIFNTENINHAGNTVWLHKSDTYKRQKVPIPYQRRTGIMTSTRAKMSYVQLPGDCTTLSREVFGQESIIDFTNAPDCPIPGKKHAHDAVHHVRTSEEQRQSKCSPDSSKTLTNGDCATPTTCDENPHRWKLTNKKVEAKRVRNRMRYANMTPEQREARCERQRVQYALRSTLRKRSCCANMTPEQKRTKIACQKARRELQRNTLCKESIAIENTMYNPSDVSLHVSTILAERWCVPATSHCLEP